MTDTDDLYDTIIVHGKIFDTFTALHSFIRIECPEKLADFQRNYGKCSYYRNTLTVF
jgi:hypothetical protein